MNFSYLKLLPHGCFLSTYKLRTYNRRGVKFRGGLVLCIDKHPPETDFEWKQISRGSRFRGEVDFRDSVCISVALSYWLDTKNCKVLKAGLSRVAS